MRIGVISTYPPIECGIASYTKYLVDALRPLGNEVYVVSPFGAEGKMVFPVFHFADSDLPEKIFHRMNKFIPDIVHVQHEYGLFGDRPGLNFLPLLYKFKIAKIPLIITLHSVYEDFTEEQKIILRGLLPATDGIIVHEEYQKDAILKKIGKYNNIFVIPHGVREVSSVPDARVKIGLSKEDKVVLLAGYFRPAKRFERIVKIFPEIVKREKKAILIIASKMRTHDFTEEQKMFLQLIDESPAADRIKILRGQFPQEIFDTILSAADVIPLPYLEGAQSGFMAQCLALGRPVVVSPDVRATRELVEKSNCGFVAKNDGEFIDSIVKILKDEELAKKLSKNALDYVRKNLSWNLIAQKTMDACQKLIPPLSTKAKIIHLA